jgi:hypothetical protein
MKENGGEGDFKYDIFDILQSFYKFDNVPLLSTTIKKNHIGLFKVKKPSLLMAILT